MDIEALRSLREQAAYLRVAQAGGPAARSACRCRKRSYDGGVNTPRALARWHDLVRTRDVRGLKELLADDCVFHSPVVHTPQAGQAAAFQYLAAAFEVFFNPSFR